MSEVQDGTVATVWPLGPELTIAQASEVHLQLLQVLSQLQGDLSLSMAAVDEFDSAGIQLLLATRRSLEQRGASLHLLQASAVVRAALSCYGLDTQLLPAQRTEEA